MLLFMKLAYRVNYLHRRNKKIGQGKSISKYKLLRLQVKSK